MPDTFTKVTTQSYGSRIKESFTSVIMLIGITMIFKPLTTVADVVPLFGSMLGAGVFVFALLMSLGLTLLTISVAWIFYRPLIGIPLAVVAVGAIAALVVMGMKKKKAAG
jgi:hypothetical protein